MARASGTGLTGAGSGRHCAGVTRGKGGRVCMCRRAEAQGRRARWAQGPWPATGSAAMPPRGPARAQGGTRQPGPTGHDRRRWPPRGPGQGRGTPDRAGRPRDRRRAAKGTRAWRQAKADRPRSGRGRQRPDEAQGVDRRPGPAGHEWAAVCRQRAEGQRPGQARQVRARKGPGPRRRTRPGWGHGPRARGLGAWPVASAANRSPAAEELG